VNSRRVFKRRISQSTGEEKEEDPEETRKKRVSLQSEKGKKKGNKESRETEVRTELALRLLVRQEEGFGFREGERRKNLVALCRDKIFPSRLRGRMDGPYVETTARRQKGDRRLLKRLEEKSAVSFSFCEKNAGPGKGRTSSLRGEGGLRKEEGTIYYVRADPRINR